MLRRLVRGFGSGGLCLVLLGSCNAFSQDVYELPAIEVTAASPIAKPKKTSGNGGGASPAPARGAVPAAQAPAAQPGSGELDLDIPAGMAVIAGDSFVPVTVATGREILSNYGATITDSLQNKPGISGTTFAPGANRPIVRGLDSYRVRIQENGIGTHDVSAISEDHAVPIDPSSASRIEVVRGPATLRYGSQAIGGLVSVENDRIPEAMPEGGFTGTVRGGGNTVDEGGDGGFSVTGGAKGVVLHADGFSRDSNDYATPLGEELNTFVESKGGAAGISHVWKDGFIGVSFARFESLYGIPGDEAEQGVLPKIDLEQDKVTVRGEWRPNNSGVEAVRLWFGASDYAHDELAIHGSNEEHEEEEHEHEEEEHEEEGFEIGSTFTNKQQEGRMEVQHMPVASRYGPLRGTVGIHWDHADTTGLSFEGDSLLEPANTESFAGFWFEELQASDRLRLQAALRLEGTSVDGTGFSSIEDPEAPVLFSRERSFAPLSGGIGALYDIGNNVTFMLNGQAVERAPAAAELFSKGMHEATGTFEIGNPFLLEEKAQTLEAGLKRAAGRFRFDANAYYTRYDGFIYRQLTGLVCGVTLDSCHSEDGEDEAEEHGHEFDQVLFLQRDATFYGAELLGQYDVAPLWRGTWGIEGQYDFVRARFDEGGNVPRIPPHRLGGGVYYKDNKWFARTAILHAFEQNDVAPNELTTPGYTLLTADISYAVKTSGPGGLTPAVLIGLKGENLLDERVLNSASFKRREDVFEPGANVRLFGSVRF